MLGVDHVVAWPKAWMLGYKASNIFKVQDGQGQVYEAQVHSGWQKSGAMDLVGRVTDLANAYKQLPVHPADA